jgi:hypothetical protein
MTLFSICKTLHYIDNDILLFGAIILRVDDEIYLPSSTARVTDMSFVAAQPTLLYASCRCVLTVIREWSAGHWQTDVEFLYQGNWNIAIRKNTAYFMGLYLSCAYWWLIENREINVWQKEIYVYLLLSPAVQSSAGYGLLAHEVSWSHTTTRHSR